MHASGSPPGHRSNRRPRPAGGRSSCCRRLHGGDRLAGRGRPLRRHPLRPARGRRRARRLGCNRRPRRRADRSRGPRGPSTSDAARLPRPTQGGSTPPRHPLQIIRPETWGDQTKPPEGVRRRKVQDISTRAWNIHTALYYKARGTPWRLVRSYADTTTCYLGVSFYRSADGSQLHTSVAQLNEKGEGVVVRGGPAAVLKEDRQPHLTEEDAAVLLHNSIAAYRKEHGTFPARLVIHKTSRFTDPERAGFAAAADAAQIDQLEEIWVTVEPTRLYRPGEHPPLRGTALALANDRFALYTAAASTSTAPIPACTYPPHSAFGRRRPTIAWRRSPPRRLR